MDRIWLTVFTVPIHKDPVILSGEIGQRWLKLIAVDNVLQFAAVINNCVTACY